MHASTTCIRRISQLLDFVEMSERAALACWRQSVGGNSCFITGAPIISVIVQHTIVVMIDWVEEDEEATNMRQLSLTVWAGEEVSINHWAIDHPITIQQISTKLSLNFLLVMSQTAFFKFSDSPKFMTVAAFQLVRVTRTKYYFEKHRKKYLQD